MYEYKIKVRRVVDGDTVDVDIDLGFGVWLYKQRVRLFGIDTPESRTRDLEEKKFGLKAKEYLKKWITTDDDRVVSLLSHGSGKFGRILGELFVTFNDGHPVFSDRVNVNETMVEDHHAVKYHGQSKDEIAEGHLQNRKLIMEKENVE